MICMTHRFVLTSLLLIKHLLLYYYVGADPGDNPEGHEGYPKT